MVFETGKNAQEPAAEPLIPASLAVEPEAALRSLVQALHRQPRDQAPAVEAEALRAEVQTLREELEAVRRSASWRLMSPLRHVMRRFPRVRAVVRRALGRAYRSVGPARAVQARKPKDPRVFQPDGEPVERSRRPERDASLALPLAWASPARPVGPVRLAAVVHLYYEELADECRGYLAAIDEGVDVFVSTCSERQAGFVRSAFQGWDKGAVDVRVVPNRGRDIAPKLVAFKDVYARYAYVLHLHGKRSVHASVLAPWRQFMLESLIGDGRSARSVIALMDALPRLGMVAVQHFEPMRHWLNWGANFDRSQALASRMGFSLDIDAPLDFPAGSMFWARSAAFRPLLDLGLQFDDFEPEAGQKDATLAHAVERLFFFSCERSGHDWLKVARPPFYAGTPRIETVTSSAGLAPWVERNRFRLLAPGAERPRDAAPEAVLRPTAALVQSIQGRVLGRGIEPPACRVVIGLAGRGPALPAPSSVRRALAAAEASLAAYAHAEQGAVRVWSSDDAVIDLSSSGPRVQRVVGGQVGFGAAHERMMSQAFAEGATHYVALDMPGLLHWRAVSALMDMMAANRDRVLLQAVQLADPLSNPCDVYSFDAPRVDGGCVAIPRALFEAVGGIDESLPLPAGREDLATRTRTAGFGVKTCPKALFLSVPTPPDAGDTTSSAALALPVDCVVRFHDIERLPELERCMFLLVGQVYRPLRIVLVTQHFSQDQRETVRRALAPLLALPEAPGFEIVDRARVEPIEAQAALWNLGLSLATGRYVAFFDAAGMLFPQALERLVARLQATDAAIAFACLRPVTDDVQVDFVRVSALASPPAVVGGLRDLLGDGFCPPHSALIDRQRLPPGVLRFDEALPLEAHRDLFMRICACAPADFGALSDTVGEQQWGGDGLAAERPMADRPDVREQAAVGIELRRLLTRVGPDAQRTLGNLAFDPTLTIRGLVDRVAERDRRSDFR